MQGQRHVKLRSIIQRGILVPAAAGVEGLEIYRAGQGIFMYVESLTLAADAPAASVWLGDGSPNAWDAITDSNSVGASVPSGGNYNTSGYPGAMVPSGSLWLAAFNAAGVRVQARCQLGLYVPQNFDVEPGFDLGHIFGDGFEGDQAELAWMTPEGANL